MSFSFTSRPLSTIGLTTIICPMGRFARALSTTLILACICQSALADSVFSDYDFTFYETVSESLAIMDSSTIGFDYTGFGFVGGGNTHGLFVRFGLQMPYSSLANLFVRRDAPGQDASGGTTTPETGGGGQDADPGSTAPPTGSTQDTPAQGGDIELVTGSSSQESLKSEYRLTFILGPALRHVFTPYLDLYAGIGPKLEEYITVDSDRLSTARVTTYDTVLALDFDIGVKFNLGDNTSCRIGVYSTYELLSYTYSTTDDADGRRMTSTSDIHLNAIATGESRIPLSAIGYISMGTTFSSSMRTSIYRYETTSPEIGQGESVIIGQE